MAARNRRSVDAHGQVVSFSDRSQLGRVHLAAPGTRRSLRSQDRTNRATVARAGAGSRATRDVVRASRCFLAAGQPGSPRCRSARGAGDRWDGVSSRSPCSRRTTLVPIDSGTGRAGRFCRFAAVRFSRDVHSSGGSADRHFFRLLLDGSRSRSRSRHRYSRTSSSSARAMAAA